LTVPARYLPSMATQAARRASLPDPQQLRARLHAATAALAVRAERLEPFIEDVARARTAPLLTLADLQGTSFATGFDALMMHQHDRWIALLPLHAAQATVAPAASAMQQLRSALERAAPGQAQLLNLKSESDALYASYLSEALRLSRSRTGGYRCIIARNAALAGSRRPCSRAAGARGARRRRRFAASGADP
jgi:predicted exporter